MGAAGRAFVFVVESGVTFLLLVAILTFLFLVVVFVAALGFDGVLAVLGFVFSLHGSPPV